MPARERSGPLTGLLQTGAVELLGVIPGASNQTYLCTVTGGETVLAVYKPQAGERPLHDFPDGTLYRREIAAALLDEILGWGLVPHTIERGDLPQGVGSLQAFVEPFRSPEVLQLEGVAGPVDLFDPDAIPAEYAPIFAALLEDGERVVLAHETSQRLRRVALFDAIANNADRKGSHLIDGNVVAGQEPRLHGIDHGLTFHAEPKLRTVLWGFAGEKFSDDELDALVRVAERAATELDPWLAEEELGALAARVAELRATGAFPLPPEDRSAIPWPPL